MKHITTLALITAATILFADKVSAQNTPPQLTGIDAFDRERFEYGLMNTPYPMTFDKLRTASDLRDLDDDPVSFVITSFTGTLTMDGAPIVPGSTVFGPTNTLVWTPPTKLTGLPLTAFTVVGFDGVDTSDMPVPVLIDVINPTPVFMKGPDQYVLRTGDPEVIFDWAIGIGPEESVLSFEVTNDNPSLFLSQPEVTPEGTLMYAVDYLHFGTAHVTVVLKDTDGRRSAPQTFAIHVQHVNYPPMFQIPAQISVEEDCPLQRIENFLTELSPGPFENWQTTTVTVTTSNLNFYAVRPSIDATGALVFKPAENFSGEDTLCVTVTDDGGTANDGWNKARKSFRLKVTPVNDAPAISLPGIALTEDISSATVFGLIDVDSPAETLSASVAAIDANFFSSAEIQNNNGSAVLKLTPASHAAGRTSIMIKASDGSATASYTVPVTIAAVNDPPEFTLQSDVVIASYIGSMNTLPNFANDITSGKNETSQAVTFEVTSMAAGFFSVRPTITPNGTLSFKLADNASGSVTLNVVAKDNGGTASGGVNVSSPKTFRIVVPENRFSTFKGIYNGLFFESDEVRHQSSGFFTLTVKDKGFFSGKILIDGGVYSFSSQFTLEGNATLAIARAGKTSLKLTAQLDNGGIKGSVTDGNWTADLAADKSVFNAAIPSPFAGKYTLALPKGEQGPAGDSVATATIAPAGNVAVSVSLADGTIASQTVPVSAKGYWPFYVSLYGGRGSVLGWLTVTNSGTSAISGAVSWIKASGAASLSQETFTNELAAAGSAFVPPVSGPVLKVNSGTISLDGGKLSQAVVKTVNLNAASNGYTGSGLTMNVNAKSGLVTGTFLHPDTKLPTPIKAVVRQNQCAVNGFFLSGSTAGELTGFQK